MDQDGCNTKKAMTHLNSFSNCQWSILGHTLMQNTVVVAKWYKFNHSSPQLATDPEQSHRQVAVLSVPSLEHDLPSHTGVVPTKHSILLQSIINLTISSADDCF